MWYHFRMDTSQALGVRVLSLGEDGARALPAVIRSVRDLWGTLGGVAIDSLEAGDDAALAARTLRRWCDRDRVEAVFTVGRSGPTRGDFAPEMTAALLQRVLPGVEERMYLAPPHTPLDLLFRGKAGMRGGTLVVNLPARAARARAIVRLLGPVVRHAVEKARGSERECGRAGAAT